MKVKAILLGGKHYVSALRLSPGNLPITEYRTPTTAGLLRECGGIFIYTTSNLKLGNLKLGHGNDAKKSLGSMAN